jgi:CRISPR-associated protein Csm1
MLIVGDLSGIQDYLFDIADQQGGQSRSLRARSFFLQIVTEIAILRLLQAADWQLDHIVLRAAGKFVLQGPPLDSHRQQQVLTEHRKMVEWLRIQTGARIRLSIAFGDAQGTLPEQYRNVMSRLQQEKLRPLSASAVGQNGWQPDALVLPSIAPPCVSCRRQKASAVSEIDADGKSLALCSACAMYRKMGRELLIKNWVMLHSSPVDAFDILGNGVSFHAETPSLTPDSLGLLSLCGQKFPGPASVPVLIRRLARHIPVENHIPVDFDEIAGRSRGAPYLGILKMDVDSLGQAVYRLLENAADLGPLQTFSERLDSFFADRLDKEMGKSEWESIYTVFSGGDDLLLIGPWDVMFSFASHVCTLFRQAFHDHAELTISGSMAIVPRKTPIHRAVEQAEHLLDAAKQAGRNRFAAFGQVWEWQYHAAIQFAANCLIQWAEGSVAERGWLQTLLRMTERQEKEPLTAARLAYHVERNYPRPDTLEPEKRALRQWIDHRVRDFDHPKSTETRYLSAILRYALTATRKGETQ